MKFLFIFLLLISFIGPVVEDNKTFYGVLKDGFYNYITCLERTSSYLIDNVDIFNELSNIPYESKYKRVMKDRYFIKHFVSPGETLDDIIKTYNEDLKDLDDFRVVVRKENPKVVNENYQVKSGEYIMIPSK